MKKKYIMIFFSLITSVLLVSCSNNKEESEIIIKNEIVTTDFVSYDITRELIKNTNLTVSNIDTKTDLSGRDKNKIKNSLLFVNTNDIIEDIGEDINIIFIKDIIEQKEILESENQINIKNLSFINNEESSETEESTQNNQIVVNKDNNSNYSNETNEANTQNNPLNTTQESETETETEQTESQSNEVNCDYIKDGVKIEYVSSEISSAPSNSDSKGYKLGTYPKDYIITENTDDYSNWIIKKINSMGVGNYFAVNNGDNTYTLFQNKTSLIPKFKVITVDDIYAGKFLETIVYAESSLSGHIVENTSKIDKKIFLAKTSDIATDYWLDVKNTQILLLEIKNKLIELNPENKEIIEENYKNYNSELDSLNDKIKYIVDSSNNKLIFICGTFKYKYLIDGYNIKYVSIYDSSSQEEVPSLLRLGDMVNIINSCNIKYIIKDKESKLDSINSIKTELKNNINVVIIDTMSNVENYEESRYIDIMNNNYIILNKAIY